MLQYLGDTERPMYCQLGINKQQNEFVFGKLLFTSKFDSGNLLSVEQRSENCVYWSIFIL